MNSSQTIDQHQQADLPDFNQQNDPNQGSQVGKSNFFQLLDNIIRTDRDFSVKDFFVVDDMEARFLKGQKFNRTAFSTLVSGALYSAVRTDYLIGVTNLSYAPTIGLPRPRDVGAGKAYIIKDESGGAGTTTITVRSVGEETIDGAATTTLALAYASKEFYTDGQSWFTK